MTKHLIIIILSCLLFYCCAPSNKNNAISGVIIDPAIKNDVEKNISPSEFGTGQNKESIYNNKLIVDFYENDRLVISTQEQDNKSEVFKSFYSFGPDTLGIAGVYGHFDLTGFLITIVKGKATLQHTVASNELPSYSYKENDSLVGMLQLPCTDAQIVLSEVPDPTKNNVIYGYVEFKSADYYTRGVFSEGKEILPRKKQRENMRIYFKSAKLEF